VTYAISLQQQENMKPFLILFCLILLNSCTDKKERLSAQMIIDKAIESSCNGKCEHANIDFTFRNKCYVSNRNGGSYRYERISSDSTGVTEDILTNVGFVRQKNNIVIAVPDSMVTKYSNSINSVIYFAQLPFGLNAAAVKKELLGEALIKGEVYYKIRVSFQEEGGGKDFEDIFIYWIHKEKFTVDYLAYQYEVDGGGIRFREAYNSRVVNGIRFVDYNNYKPETLDIPLSDLDTFFEKGALKLLSKIETESVGVQITNAN
jgi:hypothetical protein